MVEKGLFLFAVRSDKGEFAGIVESVKKNGKGTLITLSTMMDGIQKFRSLYLENTIWYRACLANAPHTIVLSYNSDIPIVAT